MSTENRCIRSSESIAANCCGRHLCCKVKAQMCSRTLLLLCAVAHTRALARSFDKFAAAATGSWSGTQYAWTDGHASPGVACEAVVDEVMRSCGGAVQGIRVGDGPLLNRQDDGFCFFDCGSWTQGPTALTDGVLSLDVGLVAQSGSRVRCTASISARHVVDATVVVEERVGAMPSAKRESITATGSPWLAPRLKWARSTEEAPLPTDEVSLPGGVSVACVARDGVTDVCIRTADAALTRSYDATGALAAARLDPAID